MNERVIFISSDARIFLDCRILTKICKMCQFQERHKGSEVNEEIILAPELNFDINYPWSARSREAADLIDCFKVSEKFKKLRYINYFGKIDSKLISEASILV